MLPQVGAYESSMSRGKVFTLTVLFGLDANKNTTFKIRGNTDPVPRSRCV